MKRTPILLALLAILGVNLYAFSFYQHAANAGAYRPILPHDDHRPRGGGRGRGVARRAARAQIDHVRPGNRQ